MDREAEATLMLTTAATTVDGQSLPLSKRVFGLFKGVLLGINHFHHNLQDNVFICSSHSFLGNGLLVEGGWLIFHYSPLAFIAELDQRVLVLYMEA